MSTLQNEVLLENIFEEVLTEYYHDFNSGELSEDDLQKITYQRFQDYSN